MTTLEPGPVAHGLLLAAGAGTRMGRPKALLTRPDGTGYLEAAARALLEGGCAEVLVVLGAAAGEARRRLEAAAPTGVRAIECPRWAQGQGESLRCGLRHLRERSNARVAVIQLVDLPDVDARVIRRLLGAAGSAGSTGAGTLARAAYDGIGGHPVLLGRDHWAPAAATAAGDRGARAYLREHATVLIEAGDLAAGRDVDTPEEYRAAGGLDGPEGSGGSGVPG
ncbi:NTP transferase domain-containing protein [Pseudactinotalea sp. HY160]|uniref:nucleotidyltransferase family protein n=1 Tax=Pseudactinotalea sp. HY160 TaxID=2654490 RepID=UPI00128E54AB|nr:nucleotidyltransferase family protein [Pseudactinotalea sp. HY160]MPV49645.1 NTP transferase domain-containing protein [Pseudactinotalea sp. HY160]